MFSTKGWKPAYGADGGKKTKHFLRCVKRIIVEARNMIRSSYLRHSGGEGRPT